MGGEWEGSGRGVGGEEKSEGLELICVTINYTSVMCKYIKTS